MAGNNEFVQTMAKESDISCFAVDGVVAEMTIEVEENEQHSQKTSKLCENKGSKEIESFILESEASKENYLDKTDENSSKELHNLDDKSLKDNELVSEVLEEKADDKKNCASQEEEVGNMELLKQNEEYMDLADKEIFKECNQKLLEEPMSINSDKMQLDEKNGQEDEKNGQEDEKNVKEDEKNVQEDKKDMQQDKKDVQEDNKNVQKNKKDVQEDKIDVQEVKKDLHEDKNDLHEDKKVAQEDKQDMEEDGDMPENKKNMEKDKRDMLEDKDMPDDKKKMEKDKEVQENEEMQEDNKEMQMDEKEIQEDKKFMQMDKGEMQEKKKTNIHSKGNDVDGPKQVSKKGIKRKLSNDNSPERNSKMKKSKLGKCSVGQKRKWAADKVTDKMEENDTQKDLPKSTKNEGTSNVPIQKSKVEFGIKEGLGIKLGSIPEVKKNIKNCWKLRPLYRILYNKWYSCSVKEAREQILEFSGYPFSDMSVDLTKRRNILKVLSNGSLAEICNSLNLIKGPKLYMTSSILKFLLKPCKLPHPSKDPSFQPIVRLQKLSLDNAYLARALENYASDVLAEIELKNSSSLKSSPAKSITSKVKEFKQPNVKKPSAVKGGHLKSQKKKKKLVTKQIVEKEKIDDSKRGKKFPEPFVKLIPLTEPSEKPKQVPEKSQKLVSSKEKKK